MHTNSKLAKSIRLALMFGATATAMTGVANAQEQSEDEEAEERVERIQVTGSRLSRADVEGATPVTVIDRGDIEATGFQSVADVLRNNSFNIAGSLREDSGNTSQGQALLNLRGLGSNRTLVLLNGRRMPGSPVADGQVQNLNVIPFAAVERIEILSDGASAVYGSDAIGGVVNIILRQDFNGLEVSVSQNVSDQEGGDERAFSVVGGVSGDKGSITVGLEHDRKDIIFSRDRWFFDSTPNMDDPNMVDGLPDYQDFAAIYSQAARTIVRGDTFQYVAMADDCSVYGDSYGGPYGDGIYPGDTSCGFRHTNVSAASAGLNRYSMFVDGVFNINDDHRFYARALSSRNESFGRYAPAAGQIFWDGPLLPEETLSDGTTLAELRPGDYVLYRYDNVGSEGRDTYQYDYVNEFTTGVEGYIGAFNLDYDVGFTRSIYEMHEWGNGYVNALGASNAAAGGWDPRQPDQGQFSGILGDLRENSNRRASMVIDRVDFGISGDGPAMSQWYVGGEVRRENYRDQAQAQNEEGNIIGTAGGSSGGSRDMNAVFAEVSVPITMDWTVDGAVRYDDYSDFGGAESFKISTRYQPLDNMIIRAAYGTGFRAPSLDTLFASPSQSFAFARDIAACMGGTISQVQGSATYADDIAACLGNPTRQHQTFFAAADVGPEESTQFTAGVVFDAGYNSNFDLSFAADYYYTEIDNTITSLGAQDVMWLHFMETIDDFSGLEYNSPLGQPDAHRAAPTNFRSFDTSGIDFKVNFGTDIGPGSLVADFSMSYVLEYNSQFTPASVQQDYTDLTLNEYRADLTVGYNLGDHSVNWHMYFIPSRCHSTTLNTDTLADATFQAQCTVDSEGNTRETPGWAHNSVQYNYSTPWNGRITLGLNNVFDREPPLDENYAFSKSLYPFVGRQVLAKYTQSF